MSGGWGTPSWQGGIPDAGETMVYGRDQETARSLLTACDELGLDRICVRTNLQGFIVPDAVWDAVQAKSDQTAGDAGI